MEEFEIALDRGGSEGVFFLIRHICLTSSITCKNKDRSELLFVSGKVQSEKQKPPYFNRGNFIPGIYNTNDGKSGNPNGGVEATSILTPTESGYNPQRCGETGRRWCHSIPGPGQDHLAGATIALQWQWPAGAHATEGKADWWELEPQ